VILIAIIAVVLVLSGCSELQKTLSQSTMEVQQGYVEQEVTLNEKAAGHKTPACARQLVTELNTALPLATRLGAMQWRRDHCP
jgi:hypothetical protein